METLKMQTEVDVVIMVKGQPSIYSKARINWNAILDDNHDHLKVIPEVPDQSISVDYEVDDENGDIVDMTKSFDVKNVSIEIDTDRMEASALVLWPRELEFYSNRWQMKF